MAKQKRRKPPENRTQKIRMPSVPRLDDKSGWRQRDERQEQLLDHVQKIEPKVLDDLHLLLDLYCQLPEAQQNMGKVPVGPTVWNFGSLPRAWSWGQLVAKADAGDQLAAALANQLRDWAQRWIKDEPHWLMSRALETLHVWRKSQQDRERLIEWKNQRERLEAQPDKAEQVAQLKRQEDTVERWLDADQKLNWSPVGSFPSAQYHSSTLEEPQLFQFSHRGWRFEGEYRRDWIAELDAAFVQAKNSYVDTIVQAASTSTGQNLVPMPIQRTSQWYVEAFVKYQVKDIPKRELAEQYPPDIDRALEDVDVETIVDTIDNAVRSIADGVDIMLRSEPKGRPPGSTNVVNC